ncbi:subclass B3 metallo-beta-lactamase [Pseudoduganella sp. FT93W]|uniref:Subclass B3 metallo-beta-lactamase n=1 Tax=Duganella fentianensis TaxID=2692177 RepID=A0A845HWB6_9BURK|nr:subclass B3 metallo-beta-lactamase [Duganella fentianensis]MYN45162.1 subclass B3 metallo-beta-lactamase [Duganella fentianensis]
MKKILIAALLAFASHTAHAADDWNQPRDPFRIYGNTYYVGVAGLSSVLVTSPQGHILLDGALPDSPKLIAASIRKLGFKLRDVKLILSSHDHVDHAGGIAELQRMTGATVVASASAAASLKRGRMDKDDPQFIGNTPYAPVKRVRTVADGEVVRLGPLVLTAMATPGHTAGGTSWRWQACEKESCRNLVYADSIYPVRGEGYRFTDHPEVVAQFERSYAALNAAPCDILVTAHPSFSEQWPQLSSGQPVAMVAAGQPTACQQLVATMQPELKQRLAEEAAK